MINGKQNFFMKENEWQYKGTYGQIKRDRMSGSSHTSGSCRKSLTLILKFHRRKGLRNIL